MSDLVEAEKRREARRLIVEQHIAAANSALLAVNGSYKRKLIDHDGRPHLPTKPLYALLKRIYRTVAEWRAQSVEIPIMIELRKLAPVTIQLESTSYLTLLRAALPDVPAKKASKWAAALDAADYHGVRPGRLISFFEKHGGIEGLAKERSRLWATVEDGDWARRSPLRAQSLTYAELVPYGFISPQRSRREAQRRRRRKPRSMAGKAQRLN